MGIIHLIGNMGSPSMMRVKLKEDGENGGAIGPETDSRADLHPVK
jgi:hypothetical protein